MIFVKLPLRYSNPGVFCPKETTKQLRRSESLTFTPMAFEHMVLGLISDLIKLFCYRTQKLKRLWVFFKKNQSISKSSQNSIFDFSKVHKFLFRKTTERRFVSKNAWRNFEFYLK